MLFYKKFSIFVLGTFSTLLGINNEALAAHLVGIDRSGLRTKMENEGYLSYLSDPDACTTKDLASKLTSSVNKRSFN